MNIGINFNWYVQKHFSFDIGYRENDFIKFTDEKQFTDHLNKLCKKSIKKLIEYRNSMVNIEHAEIIILGYRFINDELWGNYHKGIISGLVGNLNNLNIFFQKLLDTNYENFDWIKELKNKTSHLKEIANNNKNNFKKEIIEIIKETRNEKKLDEKEIIIE